MNDSSNGLKLISELLCLLSRHRRALIKSSSVFLAYFWINTLAATPFLVLFNMHIFVWVDYFKIKINVFVCNCMFVCLFFFWISYFFCLLCLPSLQFYRRDGSKYVCSGHQIGLIKDVLVGYSSQTSTCSQLGWPGVPCPSSHILIGSSFQVKPLQNRRFQTSVYKEARGKKVKVLLIYSNFTQVHVKVLD